jgi:hypothetical protein
MVTLSFGAAFSVGWAQEGVAERLAAGSPAIKRWGGIVLVAVGVWFVLLGVFAETFARTFPVKPPA